MLIREQILEALANDYSSKRRIDPQIMCDVLMDLSLSLSDGGRVLDLGCGSGRFLIPLAKLFPKSEFVGFDLSPEMLASLEEQKMCNKLDNISIIKGDFNGEGWANDYENNKFDLVLIFQGIHFINNLDKFIERVSRVLKKGGRLVIASTTHDQFYRLPYCLYFDSVLKRELDRTPDRLKMIDRLVRSNYSLVNEVGIKVEREFGDEKSMVSWLKLKPFSALGYLSEEQIEKGIVDFRENVSWEKVLIDEFNIITFEKSTTNIAKI